ncbi:hypothetical protein BOTBODRAFT_42236 [Botryobasidium botryosum FD-172 SS1]|uniref:Uncharacterized protein n=1 Tax=Botryobasidium botryosum (strain FD-172 SS1) TaxID=930990 RepID=A0A067N366_BOTB1|nr:hypothetical protein BOTBODRAFT_42236 [Botryobasidium botryosum FD-172 SS1]
MIDIENSLKGRTRHFIGISEEKPKLEGSRTLAPTLVRGFHSISELSGQCFWDLFWQYFTWRPRAQYRLWHSGCLGQTTTTKQKRLNLLVILIDMSQSYLCRFKDDCEIEKYPPFPEWTDDHTYRGDLNKGRVVIYLYPKHNPSWLSEYWTATEGLSLLDAGIPEEMQIWFEGAPGS